MNPYEYEDLLVGVWEQLPQDVERKVTIAIQCDDICDQLRIAIFAARDGTQAPERLQRRQRAAAACAYVAPRRAVRALVGRAWCG